MKPFSDKQISAKRRIILVKETDNSTISNEIKVAEKLNNLIANTAKHLDIVL